MGRGEVGRGGNAEERREAAGVALQEAVNRVANIVRDMDGQERAEAMLALMREQCLRPSEDLSGSVAYWAGKINASGDKVFTRTTLGRWARRQAGICEGLVPDARLAEIGADYAGACGGGTGAFWVDGDDMVALMNEGDSIGSCMSGRGRFYALWASSGAALIYRRGGDGMVAARVLVHRMVYDDKGIVPVMVVDRRYPDNGSAAQEQILQDAKRYCAEYAPEKSVVIRPVSWSDLRGWGEMSPQRYYRIKSTGKCDKAPYADTFRHVLLSTVGTAEIIAKIGGGRGWELLDNQHGEYPRDVVTCPHCDRECDEDDLIGDHCIECGATCSDCGGVYANEDLCNIDETLICDDCRRSGEYSTCAWCGETHSDDNMIHIEGDAYCNNRCAERQGWWRCEECGEWITEDAGVVVDDMIYCPDCAPKTEETETEETEGGAE